MITKSDVNAFYCLEDLTQVRNMTASYFYRVIEALEKLDDKSKEHDEENANFKYIKDKLDEYKSDIAVLKVEIDCLKRRLEEIEMRHIADNYNSILGAC